MSDLDFIKEIESVIGKELKLCPADKDIMGNLIFHLKSSRYSTQNQR